MISIIGIGNAASEIAENFKTQSNNYKVYKLGSNQKNTKYTRKLKSFENPEEYEKKHSRFKWILLKANDTVQVFIVGSSYSSNYALGILEQLRDRSIEIFYVKPDIDLLTGIPKLLENMMFGVHRNTQDRASSNRLRFYQT